MSDLIKEQRELSKIELKLKELGVDYENLLPEFYGK